MSNRRLKIKILKHEKKLHVKREINIEETGVGDSFNLPSTSVENYCAAICYVIAQTKEPSPFQYSNQIFHIYIMTQEHDLQHLTNYTSSTGKFTDW